MSHRKENSTNFINQSHLQKKSRLSELMLVLGKRWTTEILISIGEGNSRFSSIRFSLEHISDQTLASRLKVLERYQLVSKTRCTECVQIEYHLTRLGSRLLKIMRELKLFADDLLCVDRREGSAAEKVIMTGL